MQKQLDQSNIEIEQAMLAAETAATVSEEAAVKKVKASKVSLIVFFLPQTALVIHTSV